MRKGAGGLGTEVTSGVQGQRPDKGSALEAEAYFFNECLNFDVLEEQN